MVLAVAEEQADSILSFIQQYEPNAAIIGYVHDGRTRSRIQIREICLSIIEAVRSRR